MNVNLICDPTNEEDKKARGRGIIELTIEETIKDKKFLLTEYVQSLPGADSGVTFKPLKERPVKQE